jgi:hypothetical protein
MYTVLTDRELDELQDKIFFAGRRNYNHLIKLNRRNPWHFLHDRKLRKAFKDTCNIHSELCNIGTDLHEEWKARHS